MDEAWIAMAMCVKEQQEEVFHKKRWAKKLAPPQGRQGQ